jgi:hypothetical protein
MSAKRKNQIPNPPVEDPANPTFEQLVQHEPRLGELRDLIVDIGQMLNENPTNRRFCARWCWFGKPGETYPAYIGGLRKAMIELFGWEAQRADPFLRTSEAYDVATETLCALLPACRHNGECW